MYNEEGKLFGAIGVSGGSCADHNVAWKVRHKLTMDYIPAGVSPNKEDNIVNDIVDGISASGWGHPVCAPEALDINVFTRHIPFNRKSKPLSTEAGSSGLGPMTGEGAPSPALYGVNP